MHGSGDLFGEFLSGADYESHTSEGQCRSQFTPSRIVQSAQATPFETGRLAS